MSNGLTLYHARESICSERVRMTLEEKAVRDWDDRPIRLFKDEQFDPEYLKLNPKAQVPTLVHDGRIVRESSIICDYLDACFPDPSLKPDTVWERARMQEWIKGSDEALYQSVSSFSFASVFRERLMAMDEAGREGHFRKQTDIERTHRQRSCVDHGAGSPWVLRAVVAWEKMARDLDTALADGGPWLMGDRFTLAEIALAPFLTRVDDLGLLAVFTEERPALEGWWQRIQARPSFAAAAVRIDGEEAAAYRAVSERFAPQVRGLRDRYRADPQACGAAYREPA
ncbi:MAG: glutathione S-transferase family protein [Bauldia litoralis]